MVRALLLIVALSLLASWAGADRPDEVRHGILPAVLTKPKVERLRSDADRGDSIYTVQTVRYDGREFLTIDAHVGFGVARKQIGIYAPDDDGTFHLCVFAESCAAGSIRAALDEKTGILELRERANSKLKGEVVLTCNVKTMGTQTSTRTK